MASGTQVTEALFYVCFALISGSRETLVALPLCAITGHGRFLSSRRKVARCDTGKGAAYTTQVARNFLFHSLQNIGRAKLSFALDQ